MVWIESALFIVGLILLVKGSDLFINSAAFIAKRFGISEFVIGLTLVALGTSIPELASSVLAALRHESGLIIGNIVGSNIANICLIIGVASSVSVIKASEEMLRRDGYIMLFVSFLFYAFAFNGLVSAVEAVIFLVFYFSYMLFLFEEKPGEGEYNFRDFLAYVFRFRHVVTIRNLYSKCEE